MRLRSLRLQGVRQTLLPGLVVLLIVWVMVDLGTAGWIQAKGWLGQELMQRNWDGGQRRALPWPGARTRPVARLRLPALQIDRLVVEGIATANLAWGPGLQQGRRGHRVIAAHRDTHFAFLSRVQSGQTIELEDAAGHFSRWVIDDLKIVDSRTTTIDLDAPGPLLTLVTCWPFNAVESGGPLRLLVRARPIEIRQSYGARG